MNEMNPRGMMPFGKYRGKPLEAVAQDRHYLAWLVDQPWLAKERPALAEVLEALHELNKLKRELGLS